MLYFLKVSYSHFQFARKWDNMYFSLDIIHLEGPYIIFHFWAIQKSRLCHPCHPSMSLFTLLDRLSASSKNRALRSSWIETEDPEPTSQRCWPLHTSPYRQSLAMGNIYQGNAYCHRHNFLWEERRKRRKKPLLSYRVSKTNGIWGEKVNHPVNAWI